MSRELIDPKQIWEIVVEQAQALLVEKRDEINLMRVRVMHELGELMNENKSHLEKSVYGEGWLERMAEDIGISRSVLYDAVAFATREPDVEKFINSQPKILTWSKVRTQYLPEGKIENHKCEKFALMCVVCRRYRNPSPGNIEK